MTYAWIWQSGCFQEDWPNGASRLQLAARQKERPNDRFGGGQIVPREDRCWPVGDRQPNHPDIRRFATPLQTLTSDRFRELEFCFVTSGRGQIEDSSNGSAIAADSILMYARLIPVVLVLLINAASAAGAPAPGSHWI